MFSYVFSPSVEVSHFDVSIVVKVGIYFKGELFGDFSKVVSPQREVSQLHQPAEVCIARDSDLDHAVGDGIVGRVSVDFT